MIEPAAIELADSVTRLESRHADAVLVSGSHGGIIAARYASRARVRAAIFNDAGVGFENAGIAGLEALDDVGVAAAAVSHRSARIADSRDTLDNGVLTYANAHACRCGLRAGLHCRDAAAMLRFAARTDRLLDPPTEARHALCGADESGPAVIGLDSIGCVEPADAGAILVIGSHGALHGGEPASALPVDAAAAFFHDAGRGKDDIGVSRLPVLDARGIPAGAIDYRSARIGDARSLWASGVLSSVNARLAALGVREGDALRSAVARLRRQST